MIFGPDTFHLIVYLALVVPGVVFGAMRTRLRGFVKSDTHLGSRILLAFVVSVVFDAAYAAALGPYAITRYMSGARLQPWESPVWSLSYLALAVALPSLVAWLIYKPDGRIAVLLERARVAATGAQFDSVPTAWDHATIETRANWVRVRLAPGDWIGGKFGEHSYFSTYPEARDLFVEEQWTLDDDGEFVVKVANAAGVWIAIRDDAIVEWIYGEEDD